VQHVVEDICQRGNFFGLKYARLEKSVDRHRQPQSSQRW
jgi:hypothetical protein